MFLNYTTTFSLIKSLLLAIIVSLIAFLSQYYAGSFISYLNFILILLVALFNKRKSFLIFIFSLLLFDDIPYDQLTTMNNIHVSLVFGQSIVKVLSIFFLVIILIELLKKKVIYNNLTKVFAILFIISFTVGFLNGNITYLNSFINDARFFMNYFIGFFGVYIFFNKESIIKYFNFALILYISKSIIFVIFGIYYSSNHEAFGLLADTGLYMSSFFVTYILFYKNNINNLIKILLISILILSLFVAASRGRILILLLHIIIVGLATKKIKSLRIIIFLPILILPIISYFSQEMISFFLFKINSFSPNIESGQSSLVRLIEFKNIIAINLDNAFKFIWGSGLGGYWDSSTYKYPFNLYGTTSYPDEWIAQDRFFKPHGIPQFLLLKVGFIGSAFLYLSQIKYFLYFKKMIKNEKRNLFIILASGFIFIYLVAFSSKLQLFGGVLSAFSYIIYKQNQKLK